MRLFKDKELEARLDQIEKIIDEQDKKISKLLNRLSKTKTESKDNDRERIERIDKSFQKLFNYNEDIAMNGYKK